AVCTLAESSESHGKPCLVHPIRGCGRPNCSHCSLFSANCCANTKSETSPSARYRGRKNPAFSGCAFSTHASKQSALRRSQRPLQRPKSQTRRCNRTWGSSQRLAQLQANEKSRLQASSC